jgi:hypothetical protein
MFMNTVNMDYDFRNKSQDLLSGEQLCNSHANSPDLSRKHGHLQDSELGIEENQNEEDKDSFHSRNRASGQLILPDAFLKSKRKPQMVEFVQIESPSHKYQAKLMEKEKEKQHQTMETRLRKLQIDQERAEKQLKRTMDQHYNMTLAQDRKSSAQMFK